MSSTTAPRPRRVALAVSLTLTLAAAACRAPGPIVTGLSSAPQPRAEVETYPPWAASGPVRVEARYYLDQATLMGGDLLEGFDLVPVALRMGVVPGTAEAGELAAVPDEMQLVLHLADGTPLRRVAPADLDVRRRRLERLVREAFEGGLLPPWESAREGFVYFALPEGARGDSRELTLRVPAAGGTRTLDLGGSLVSFELPLEGDRRRIHVGLQLDRRGARLEGVEP